MTKIKARNPSRVAANASGDRQIAVTRDMTPDYERESKRDRERLSKGESAHTPGPWKIEFFNANPKSESPYYKIDSEREGIAHVYGNEANAKLIAAAPETAAERDKLREQRDELLQGCLLALSDIRRLYCGQPDEDYADNKAVKFITKAIKKAEAQ